MPDQTGNNTHPRQHVTTACVLCRASKIKCDGKHPSCDQCSVRNRHCVYDSSFDRRKISLRKAVETFSRRVEELERFIRTHGLQIPPPVREADASMLVTLTAAYPLEDPTSSPPVNPLSQEHGIQGGQILDLLSLPGTYTQAPTTQPSSNVLSDLDPGFRSGRVQLGNDDFISIPQLDDTFHLDSAISSDWVWSLAMQSDLTNLGAGLSPGFSPGTIGNDAYNMLPSPPQAQTATVEPVSVQEESSDDDSSEVTVQLSGRIGSLLTLGNGDRRFYGATSNMHFVAGRHVLGLPSKNHFLKLDAQEMLDSWGVGHAVDPDLRTHLIDHYFRWYNPSMYLVDRDVFEIAHEKYRQYGIESKFFSEFLLNCICAVGAAFDTSMHTDLPQPLPEFFAARAKACLELEIDRPRIATCQGLALLSIHETAATRDTPGWLFSGMSVRLAYDLGLHVSNQQYINDKTMTVEEALVRSMTFWSVFINDGGWGLYLGRPFHTETDNIMVERPIFFDRHRGYISWSAEQSSESSPSTYPQGLLSDNMVSLFEILSPLSHHLYSRLDATDVELQALAELTFNRLEEWKRTLPTELRLDYSSLDDLPHLPQLLTLHMQYSLFMIILHRPFVAKDYIQPKPLIGRGPMHAREMCVRSAINIATLLACYERQHSLRKAPVNLVHIAFTAALILVFATISDSSADVENQLTQSLDICCRALAGMGDMYNNASRSLDILLATKRSWQARLVTKLRTKRPSWHGSQASGDSTRKRIRSTVNVS